MEQHKRGHALGCSRCGSELDSESCDVSRSTIAGRARRRHDEQALRKANAAHRKFMRADES